MRYRNERFGLGGGFGTTAGYKYPGAGYGYNVGQGYPVKGYGAQGPGFGGFGYGSGYPGTGYGYGPGYGPGFGGPGFGAYGFNPLTTGLLGFGAGLLGGAFLTNNGPFRGYYYYR